MKAFKNPDLNMKYRKLYGRQIKTHFEEKIVD